MYICFSLQLSHAKCSFLKHVIVIVWPSDISFIVIFQGICILSVVSGIYRIGIFHWMQQLSLFFGPIIVYSRFSDTTVGVTCCLSDWYCVITCCFRQGYTRSSLSWPRKEQDFGVTGLSQCGSVYTSTGRRVFCIRVGLLRHKALSSDWLNSWKATRY